MEICYFVVVLIGWLVDFVDVFFVVGFFVGFVFVVGVFVVGVVGVVGCGCVVNFLKM